MQSRVARRALLLVLVLGLSGCTSDGKFSPSSLAFWKKSPPPASHVAAPAPPSASVPERPSTIGSTPAPGTGYAAAGGIAPASTYPNTPASYSSPSGYPTTGSSAVPAGGYTTTGSSAVPAGGYAAAPSSGGAYMTPQTGMYGSTAGTMPSTPAYSGGTAYTGGTPYAGGGAYAGGSPAGYTSAAAPAYGSTATARGTAGVPYSASATNATYPPANTLRMGTPTTGAADQYGAGADRYGSGATAERYSGSADPTRAASYDRYGSGSAPPAGGSGYTPAAPTARYGDHYADPGAAGTAAAGTSDDRYPSTSYGAAGATAGRYGDSTPTGGSYAPAASGYQPGSGYSVPGVPAYKSPASSYSPGGNGYATPSNTADDLPAYRPGSTAGAGDYAPTRTGTSTSSTSGYDSGVERASYTRGY